MAFDLIINGSKPSPLTPNGRRRVPGPAGNLMLSPLDTLPLAASNNGANANSSKRTSPFIIKTKSKQDHSSSGGDSDETALFRKGPWLSMLESLDLPLDEFHLGLQEPTSQFTKSLLRDYNIRYVLKSGYACKVPQLCLVLRTFNPSDADAFVTFRDPTGEMQGTIHRRVIEEFGENISTGAVFVLRRVSVFNPSNHSHYLNITPGNIVRIFPATSVISEKARQKLTLLREASLLLSADDMDVDLDPPPLPSAPPVSHERESYNTSKPSIPASASSSSADAAAVADGVGVGVVGIGGGLLSSQCDMNELFDGIDTDDLFD
eukprot:GILK01009395.1.p1 GENE.GILK01009395.1~~GILK01009395.1.p1  ORF type:complete len:320 (+),score=77.58 GILK01009395.1:178-1137(+)